MLLPQLTQALLLIVGKLQLPQRCRQLARPTKAAPRPVIFHRTPPSLHQFPPTIPLPTELLTQTIALAAELLPPLTPLALKPLACLHSLPVEIPSTIILKPASLVELRRPFALDPTARRRLKTSPRHTLKPTPRLVIETAPPRLNKPATFRPVQLATPIHPRPTAGTIPVTIKPATIAEATDIPVAVRSVAADVAPVVIPTIAIPVAAAIVATLTTSAVLLPATVRIAAAGLTLLALGLAGLRLPTIPAVAGATVFLCRRPLPAQQQQKCGKRHDHHALTQSTHRLSLSVKALGGTVGPPMRADHSFY